MIATLKSIRLRHRALAAIKAAGGKYYFRDDGREDLISCVWSLPRSLLDRTFANVNCFLFTQFGATDEALAQVARFPQLEFLSISNSPVTDQGLLFLKDLRRIKVLFADGTWISAEGLGNSAWLHSLALLGVNRTVIDDRIWTCLQQASHITELSIGETEVRSLAGLASHSILTSLCLHGLVLPKDELHHLHSVPNIRELYLNYTSFLDEDTAHLSELSQLRRLALEGTKITDHGLARLSKLTNLEELIVNETIITENGVKAIAHLPNLKFMCLTATKVTESLFAVLRIMPQLENVFLDKALCDSLTNEERSCIPCKIISIPEDQI